jgi:putative ATPase
VADGLFDAPEFAEEDLSKAPARDAPLAERMRPRTLEEFVGQRHLVGAGHVLERALHEGGSQSLILWGPPGSGKTTLARLIAAQSDARFVPFSAVLAGIKEIKAVMAAAELERKRTKKRTLVFIDEIHRFNKAQQDAFLPYVERGDILLIGATTENPSFEVISALLSRVRTVILEPLSIDEVVEILRRAIDDERGLARGVQAEDEVLASIAHASDGDARRALTLLETAAELASAGASSGSNANRVTSSSANASSGSDGTVATITPEIVREALQRKSLHYDKSGEEHYNLISALHKSIRNSDENAALYWIARMMESGEDGNYIARRLIRMASEDIGLADPLALRVALDAGEAFERLGYPEGKLMLAQAAVYLARAKKSNAVYIALGQAEDDVEKTAADPVPLHLRNAPTGLMKAVGYGKGYRYAHDDPDAMKEMKCLPPKLEGRRYFGQSTEHD